MQDPDWLTLSRELQAIAQTGLAFSKDPYDLQRYRRIRELAASMLTLGSGGDFQRILGLFEGETGYATPKVDVRGAVFRDGRILMVREAVDGLWTLPGGWADVNQSPAECTEREVLEESGFEVRASKLAAVWDFNRQGHGVARPHSIYKLFFLCELRGGSPRPSEETTEVAFFAADALPPLSPGRITTRQIGRMFDHQAYPGLRTDFE